MGKQKNNKIKLIVQVTIHLAIFLLLVMPLLSSAAGLVTCGGKGEEVCDFTAFLGLINTVIDFIFKFLAVPIAAIMFAYAGFLLITAGGGEAKTKAKKIFTNAIIGLIFAAGSWLIVKTLLSILGYNNVGLFFN